LNFQTTTNYDFAELYLLTGGFLKVSIIFGGKIVLFFLSIPDYIIGSEIIFCQVPEKYIRMKSKIENFSSSVY